MRLKTTNSEAAPPPLFAVLAHLADSARPLSNIMLAELANLDAPGLASLAAVWPTLSLKRRRQVTARLVEISENNFDLCFDELFRYLLEDTDAEVRLGAIDGLWCSEEATLINPLINLLQKDTSLKVQAAAALALGRFVVRGQNKKLSPRHLERVNQALLDRLAEADQAEELRSRLIEAAAPIDSLEVKRAIVDAYQNPDIKMKSSALYAMGRNCQRAWLPLLVKELSSPHAELRFEAAGALGEMEDEEAVSFLVRLINDPDVDIQLAAIQSLGKIGGSQAREFLEKQLEHASPAIRLGAEQALLELRAGADPIIYQNLDVMD
jgi:HEAT repeat protein